MTCTEKYMSSGECSNTNRMSSEECIQLSLCQMSDEPFTLPFTVSQRHGTDPRVVQYYLCTIQKQFGIVRGLGLLPIR